MNLRRSFIALALVAVGLGGTATIAGAAAPGFTVPATTIQAGDSLTVTLTDECVDQAGDRFYGNLNQYNETTGSLVSNRDIKGKDYINGASATYTFPTPGTYTLQRFCDFGGFQGLITITVLGPSGPTTTAPTTAAPSPTTTSGGSPTTSAPPAPTTTAAVVVEGATSSNTSTASSSSTAKGATAMKAAVSYAG